MINENDDESKARTACPRQREILEVTKQSWQLDISNFENNAKNYPKYKEDWDRKAYGARAAYINTCENLKRVYYTLELYNRIVKQIDKTLYSLD
jgi:hypothetical protein